MTQTHLNLPIHLTRNKLFLSCSLTDLNKQTHANLKKKKSPNKKESSGGSGGDEEVHDTHGEKVTMKRVPLDAAILNSRARVEPLDTVKEAPDGRKEELWSDLKNQRPEEIDWDGEQNEMMMH